jgi:alanyl-tRNA synthetase
VDLLKEGTDKSVIALGSKSDNRALLVIGVTADLCVKGLDASRVIRQLAVMIGGSGGGRKDFAQAGGNKPENLQEALEELKNIIKSLP